MQACRASTRWTMTVLFILGLAPVTALGAPVPPQLDKELPRCQALGGTEPALPVATDYPGGYSATSGGLTPATAPGAITVKPKTAACLIEAMGSELLVFAAVKDESGIPDAYRLPIGSGASLQEDQEAALKYQLSRIADDRLDRPILVYCHSITCFLSYNGILRLRELGYTKLLWMREGIKGWKEAGLPVGMTRVNGGHWVPPVSIETRAAEKFGDRHYPTPYGYYEKNRFAPLKAAGIELFKLCYEVKHGNDSKASDTDDEAPYFEYQVELYRLAGVDYKTDNELVIRRKIRTFWEKYGDLLECHNGIGSSAGFDGYGSLLKHAVSDSDNFINTELIEDAVFKWQLPLNKVDRSDGRTLLDFVEDSYNLAPDILAVFPDHGEHVRSRQRTWTRVYRVLRRGGAKHRRELEAEGLWKPAEVLQAEAIPTYRAAADKGDIGAMFKLMLIYGEGYSVPRNLEERQRWLDRASARSIASADHEVMIGIASSYKEMGETEKRLEWLRRAADIGSSRAMCELGHVYLYSEGRPRNLRTALDWYTRGFHQGKKVENNLYEHCARGIGMIHEEQGNLDEAALWYRWLFSMRAVHRKSRDGTEVDQWLKQKGIPLCGPGPDGNKLNCMDGGGSH